MLKAISNVINRFRTAALLRVIGPYINDKSKVIDVGAGWCHVAWTISEKIGAEVTAIDVVDHNITPMPLKIYDGKKLPYKDKAFDVGLLAFVLHHADDPEGLLNEALRVSKLLIIVEDTPEGHLEKAVWKKFDYMVNHQIHDDIKVAHGSVAASQWKALIHGQGAKVVHEERFRSFFTTFRLYPHTAFVVTADRTSNGI